MKGKLKGYLVVDENLIAAAVEKNQYSNWFGTLWQIQAPEEKPTVFSSIKAARKAIGLTRKLGKEHNYSECNWHILKFVDEEK